MRQHDQRDMMMPTCPTAAFVMIQPQFLLELLTILFDLPAGFDDAHQPPQRVVLRQVAEKVFGRFFFAARPFHQQPDLLVRGSALVESMRGLHAASIEAGLEPALAAFSPAHLLPPAGLLRHLPDGAGPLRAVGAVVDESPGERFTPLMMASEEGELDILQALLAKGANVNARTTEDDGTTPLIFASEEGHADVVQVLLARGANVNAKKKDGGTALMIAAYKGHPDVVQALLAKGAEVNVQDKRGWTALMYGADGENLAVVQALLASGANVNARMKDGGTALMDAADNCTLDVLQALLARGANVNAKTGEGETALMDAAYKGCLDVVRALLTKGADLRAQAKDGKTALDVATAERHADVIALLEQAAAKP